ncbi:MAG: sugar ABC transporter permease [Microbacteriaceae bacterium]
MNDAIALTSARTRTTTRRVRRRALWSIPFLAPGVFFLIMVILIPAAQGTAYAFTDWDGLSQDFTFIGFGNFVEMLVDPLGRGAIVQTLVITLLTVVFQTVAGVVLAVGLNSRIRMKGLLRLLFFLPVVMAPVIVAKLWAFLYVPDGAFDSILDALGLGALSQVWLGDPKIAIYAVTVVIVWQYTGLSMVVFLSGLQNVPEETIEAAHVDGAGSVRTFFSVVLPQLRPAFIVSISLAILTGLKTFDQVWVLTQGGPGTSTQTLSTAIYQSAFVFGDYGYGTALAVVLSAVAILAVVGQRVLMRGER